VRLVHEAAAGDDRRTVASRVELADSPFARARGFVGRRPPEGLALVMRFRRQARRRLHMFGVPVALDAAWVCDGVVQRVTRLRPWLGLTTGVADTVVECRAGALADVAPGDRLRVVDAGGTDTHDPGSGAAPGD